jgi:hypothetical protein
MGSKLGKKELPAGLGPDDFTYQGRPAVDQGDFGPDVGLADGACVNQFGDANNSKYYHCGVVKSTDGRWWVYREYGRIEGGKTWEGGTCRRSATFMFESCPNEDDARASFQKQMRDKNVKRLEQKGKIWVSKVGSNGKSKDGYIVQRLATRERGLPDAYGIKDDSGLEKKVAKKKTTKKKTAKRKKVDAQPQVIALARDLVGGTVSYARAASKSTGIVPTMEAIEEVRDDLIPQALKLLKKIGNDEDKQLRSKPLQELSKYVATIVPRPIPRTGDPSAILLSQGNIFSIQQDLDAFEAALKNEDFDLEEAKEDDNAVDPNKVLGRKLTWIDPKSEQGRWLESTYLGMTNNRHGHLRGRFRVLNMFSVEDAAKRKAFLDRARAIAKGRKGSTLDRAELQPKKRPDVSDVSDIYADGNLMLGIHGTRAVNVQPILSSNLRLPKQLKGVHISGSAFGAGIYFADDIKKSHGYTGAEGSYWVKGGGIQSRGFFMFLCDVTLGKPHMTRTTLWGQPNCTRGYDSIYAKRNITSVANNEYIIFDPNQQFIRYIIEARV